MNTDMIKMQMIMYINKRFQLQALHLLGSMPVAIGRAFAVLKKWAEQIEQGTKRIKLKLSLKRTNNAC